MILERFSTDTRNRRILVWIWKIDLVKDMKHLRLETGDNGPLVKMNGVMKEVPK
jgi:hypothetical protein